MLFIIIIINHHQSLNCEGCWGTADDFATSVGVVQRTSKLTSHNIACCYSPLRDHHNPYGWLHLTLKWQLHSFSICCWKCCMIRVADFFYNNSNSVMLLSHSFLKDQPHSVLSFCERSKFIGAVLFSCFAAEESLWLRCAQHKKPFVQVFHVLAIILSKDVCDMDCLYLLAFLLLLDYTHC